jgi:hypothetical protein
MSLSSQFKELKANNNLDKSITQSTVRKIVAVIPALVCDFGKRPRRRQRTTSQQKLPHGMILFWSNPPCRRELDTK